MSGNLEYQLPESDLDVARVVEAIPSRFKWVAGRIFAPQKLYEEGEIAMDICLEFASNPGEKILVGMHDVPFERLPENGYQQRPNFGSLNSYNLLFGRKLVSSVAFKKLGKDSGSRFNDETRILASEFLKRGYKGYITAFSGNDDVYGSNPEVLHIQHATPWQTPNITLHWYEMFGGNREGLDELIGVLEQVTFPEVSHANLAERKNI
jgi:hypothetical protein